MAKTVIITGASGFLGKHLCRYFAERGWVVRAMVRDVKKHQWLFAYAGGGIYPFELSEAIDPEVFGNETTLIIHSAFETVAQPSALLAINRSGTQNLLNIYRSTGIKQFFFISTLAAHPQAKSAYGRCKWELEALVNEYGGTVIKPGTIVGDGGLFERTRRLVRKSPVLPIFYGGNRRLQTIWIGDLCTAIFSLAEQRAKGTHVLAEYPGISIEEFYRLIADLENRKVALVRIPGNIFLPILYALEALKIPVPISSDNLLGLKCLKSFLPVPDSVTGIKPRPFAESIAALRACASGSTCIPG